MPLIRKVRVLFKTRLIFPLNGPIVNLIILMLISLLVSRFHSNIGLFISVLGTVGHAPQVKVTVQVNNIFKVGKVTS